MKKSLFFIGIISLVLGIIFFQNITPSDLQGSTFVETEPTDILPFSIEPTLSDQTLSLVFGGNIALQQKNYFTIPEFLQKIFAQQDVVTLHLQNQIFDATLTENKETPILEKDFLNKLFSWNITHLTVFSNKIFSRGKFFADLTVGNIIQSSLTPIISYKPLHIQKGTKTLSLLALNIQRDNNEKIFSIITKEKKENDTVILLLDFNAPTTTKISQSMRKYTHSFIDAGADIIIGLGNENILPIEKYKNKIIFYSLGTFYSDDSTKKQKGIMTEIILSPKEEKIYIHPFLFNTNNFSFFNEIDTLEFFSDTNIFFNFTNNEMKNLFNEKLFILK